jgi:hypothetical protein
VHEASKIDPWFLAQIEDLVLTEKSLVTKKTLEKYGQSPSLHPRISFALLNDHPLAEISQK